MFHTYPQPVDKPVDSGPSLWITPSAPLWITLWTEPVDRLRDLWTTEGDLWTVGRVEGVEGRAWPSLSSVAEGVRSSLSSRAGPRVSSVADYLVFGQVARLTERSRGEW